MDINSLGKNKYKLKKVPLNKLYKALDKKSFRYLLDKFYLPEDFVQRNADRINQEDWTYILICQQHIKPDFFEQFRPDMDSNTKILLDYKKSVQKLVVVMNKLIKDKKEEESNKNENNQKR